ncbi:MAG TPA: heme lyase CcmF/NrfE family subunit [Gaiellaceae bacterium]|nr:heme lyase CcmF/NrfE family subunit [Gaiellaceae bacterium]
MPELGRAALVVCFGLAVYAIGAGFTGAHLRRRRLALSAQNALVAAFAAALVAAGVLLTALVRSDFSFTYVSSFTSRDLPLTYKLTALWGGQEGSLLLWLLVLTGYGAAAVLLDRKAGRELVAWVVPVLGIVAAFFSLLVVFVASPFKTHLAPDDGLGLNSSLQSPYMQAHPPMLYLGYVGLTVPFAFAIGALLSGRTDERWIVATRRWTLAAWMFLGIGQLLGAKWAYEEVGWGGYYAWDPVENAALMPWLASTAFLHSVMVQEKKGMLKVWNMLLVVLAFSLSLFGTFLTRSGVLNSIHSFTEGSIGPWFLGFICFVVAASLLLIFRRLPLLRSRTKLESLASREATFLYNNLLLVALCLTILWGVTFPILSEAVRGESVTVGRPYYDFFLRAFGLPLLLLMGIGPLVAWRRASLRSLARTFLWPFVLAVAAGGGLIAAGAGSSVPGLIAYTFSAFVAATIVLEFARGTAARRALSRESIPAAFGQLVARNRRRYGGYVVHAAIVLLAIGIAGSSAYDTSRSARLAPGQSLKVRDYTLVYRGLRSTQAENATETRATIDVFRGGHRLSTLHPGKNSYPVEQQVSNEVAIRSDWLTGEDLFLITEQVNRNGTIDFKAIINPLVNLIWLAGIVFLLGSLVALWPDAREERRLAVRYGRLPQEA